MKRLALIFIILLSIIPWQTHYPQTAILDSLRKVIHLASTDSTKVTAMSNLSQKYMETDLDMAQAYADSVKLLSEASGHNKGIALAHSLNGLIQTMYGNYENALSHNLKALELRKKLLDKDGVIKSLNNIGNVYRQLQQYEKAIQYHKEAIALARVENNNREVAHAMNNIGNSLILKNELKEAIIWFDSSYHYLKELNDYVGMAGITGNIGAVHYYNKDTLKALGYFKESLRLREQLNDRVGVVAGEINIGQINSDIGKISEALKYFESALEKATEMKLKERIQLCYLGLSDTYAKAGNYEKAFQFNRLYVMYRDTLMNEDMNNKISEMQAQFDSDMKDKEIELLGSENKLHVSELKKEKNMRYAFMSAALGMGVFLIMGMVNIQSRKRRREAEFNRRLVVTEMKALRSQMNPHFIFNSLQSIQNFLLNHQNDEANEYLLKFASLIRRVLENSMHQEISLRDELDALELFMQLERLRLPYPFEYEFDLSGDLDPDETFVPPLIMQPFVENAIWHGLQHKNGPGKLCIRIHKGKQEVHIIIEDDGVGYSAEKPASTVHRFPKKESLGMKLTEERLRIVNELRKVKAWFEVTDRQGEGTRVRITLPL